MHAKIKSHCPGLETYSATKRVLSNFKTELSQIEQELSHSQTLGHTPTRTPPPCRSSAKRRKISDDHFKSIEKRVELKRTSVDVFNPAATATDFEVDSLRGVILDNELQSLRQQRNDLCGRFIERKSDIPDFCIQLDVLGKKFENNCLFASIYNLGK